VIAAGGLAAAELGTACPRSGEAAKTPSKLDYMVLASFVESPHLLAMASYRSTPREDMIKANVAPAASSPRAAVARP
jgi:hypothetical protein